MENPQSADELNIKGLLGDNAVDVFETYYSTQKITSLITRNGKRKALRPF